MLGFLGGAAKLAGGLLKSKIASKVGRVIAGKSKTANAILGGSTAAAGITMLPRVIPAIGGVARKVGGALGPVLRNPAVQGAAGAAAGAAIVGYLADGTPVMGRRRRGRGFTARDIRQTRRMLRLIKEMQGCIPKRKC